MPAQVDAHLPIAITGLTRRFGTIDALSDLTLSVATGEMVAVVGPDGAGKSTLMRTPRGRSPAPRRRRIGLRVAASRKQEPRRPACRLLGARVFSVW